MHYLALTFKHAVEFSSFGCTPRICLATPAWGNSTYFIRVPPRSQIRISTHCAICFPVLDPHSRPIPCSNSTYFIQTLSRSQIRLSDPQLHFHLFCVMQFRLRGNLSYLTEILAEVKRLGDDPAPPAPDDPRTCRRVPERAGPRTTWFGWFPLGSAAARSLLLAASRTPQGSENVTRADRRSQIAPGVIAVTSGGHGREGRSSDTAPTVRLPRRVITNRP